MQEHLTLLSFPYFIFVNHLDYGVKSIYIFDEGRLTDGKGKTIECKDAIFIMTSNLAATEIADHGLQLRKEVEKIAKERVEGTSDENDLLPNANKINISRHFKEKVVQPILKYHFGINSKLSKFPLRR